MAVWVDEAEAVAVEEAVGVAVRVGVVVGRGVELISTTFGGGSSASEVGVDPSGALAQATNNMGKRKRMRRIKKEAWPLLWEALYQKQESSLFLIQSKGVR